ncbi:MAG TPA: glycosyltransferase [Solirubrobacteraceae bacterium]|nr:glycosyltransferase [Solirubrobacteraceae bacterium]
MRLAIYCDFTYRLDAGELYAEVPFAVFLGALGGHCERLTLTGRLDPTPGRHPYRIDGVEFVPLPYYPSGAQLGSVMRALPAGMWRFWRLLGQVDTVWVLGPNPPQAVAFALLAKLRRRRVVLGVRQHLPTLIRHRRRDARTVRAAAVLLEGAFRLLARVVPVVVVGPDLARRYRNSASVHVAIVSLLHESDIVDSDGRDYDSAELRLLSVGRIDPEKNPLLLADVLAQALRQDPRWRLEVCGDGPLRSALGRRLERLGIADRAVLHGHLPLDGGLWDLYRASHALLHVSLTEGVPQVLLEAFAAGLPVVATAVGGVPETVAGRGLVIPPADAPTAATALQRVVADPELRGRLTGRATSYARRHTLHAECDALASFLDGSR